VERKRIEKRGTLKRKPIRLLTLDSPSSSIPTMLSFSTQIVPASGCIQPIVSFKVTLFPIPLRAEGFSRRNFERNVVENRSAVE